MLQPTAITVRTGPGERWSLTLAEGTTIALNGDTRLVIDRGTPRAVERVAGEASFAVRHDPGAPFEVFAGETRLRDLGTAFDVVRSGGAVDAAVASGSVLVNPDADRLTLQAGDAMHDPAGPGAVTRSRVAPSAVGGRRTGRLVCAGATLAQVAAAIGRSVAPSIAGRGFGGVIIVRGDREALLRRLGPLLDVAIVRDGRAVRLVPRAGS